MDESALFLIGGIVGMAFGLLMMPIGFHERKKKQIKFGDAAFTKGKVLGEDESDQAHGFASFSGGGASAKRFLQTRFSFNFEGIVYFGKSGIISNTRRYDPGTVIEVIFNPEDPKENDIHDASFRLMPLIPFFLGGVFIIGGGFLLYAYKTMS